MYLRDICTALLQHAQENRFLPGGLIFGHMDYCSNLGMLYRHCRVTECSYVRSCCGGYQSAWNYTKELLIEFGGIVPSQLMLSNRKECTSSNLHSM